MLGLLTTTTQSFTTAVTSAVLWDSLRAVAGGSITYNSSTGAFTIPVTGIWTIEFNANWTNSTTAWNRTLMQLATGAGTFRNDYTKQGWLTSTQLVVTANLVAGSTVTAQLNQNSGSSQTIDSGSWITLRYLG